MNWQERRPHERALVEVDRIDATANLRAEPEAISFKTQKACVVHGPFIPCDDTCPRIPATYTMKRDQKRGAHLRRNEQGRMVLPFNFGTPHFGCLCGPIHPCKHERTEKLKFENGKVESVCVQCGTRVA